MSNPKSCLCGWRAESPDTHPHVGGCEWAALERERDEWKNLAKSCEGVFSERDEAHAAIRALVYMGEVYDTATAHAPYDCQCFRCDTLKKHAPAIARATNQPTQPDREPPFHFCDQIRENLVGPKSACEFCRATGEGP